MHKDGLHTGDYIRSVKFDYAVRGYRVTDVEMFLDEVANDVDKLVSQNRALSERLSALMKERDENPVEVQKTPEAPEVRLIIRTALKRFKVFSFLLSVFQIRLLMRLTKRLPRFFMRQTQRLRRLMKRLPVFMPLLKKSLLSEKQKQMLKFLKCLPMQR